MSLTFPTHVIGDVHGQLGPLSGLLHEASFIDEDLAWCGGAANLLFLGDFFDRGPDGVGVVDLVMRLQGEAKDVGGGVTALLGNHEVLILAAQRFGARRTTGPGGTFLGDWEQNGGNPADLAGLTPKHTEWLRRLPAMLLLGDHLYAHADATFYETHGCSVGAVNEAFRRLLESEDAEVWDGLLEAFSERNTFLGPGGTARAEAFLGLFGGSVLVHGHTPISTVTNGAPESVTRAYEYAGGRCVNVDHGLFLGGRGFVYRSNSVEEG